MCYLWVFGYLPVFHSEHVELRGQLEESVLSDQVVPRDQIQVIRLHSRCLKPIKQPLWPVKYISK